MSNIDKHAVQAVAGLKAGYTLGHADVAILNELARIALASLEVEPVAYMYKDNLHADARFSLHTRFGNSVSGRYQRVRNYRDSTLHRPASAGICA